MRGLVYHLLSSLHRLALQLYPRHFRRCYADDMVEVFDDVLRAAARRHGVAHLATRGGWHLYRTGTNGLAERFGGGRRPSYQFSPRFEQPARIGARQMSSFLQDVRFALRSLRQRPGFACLVIGLLALGIGANTAIFSIFNGIYLRPMPFGSTENLVVLDETAPQWNLESVGVSHPDFAAWAEQNRTFESMAVFDDRAMNLRAGETVDRVGTALVSWQLATVLDVQPLLGRDLTADDDREGAEPVALLTHAAWRDRFGADPDVIGTPVQLDEMAYTVVGVLPETAVIPRVDVEFWLPVHSVGYCCEVEDTAGSWWLSGLGRLREGVTIEQALADLDRIHATLPETLGDSRTVATPRLDPFMEIMFGDNRIAVMLLGAAVGVLLLIACANIGGLMLARATSRTREIGLRAALGAGRGRLVRQLLTESLVLASLGGILGMVIGHAGFRALVSTLPESQFGWLSVTLDWRFAAFTLAVTGGAALLFGLWPALSTARVDPQESLQETGRSSATHGRRRALNGLVVSEIALAVVLLVAAGLLVRAFQSLNDIDPGFRTDVFTAAMALPETGYEEHTDRVGFFAAVEEELRGTAGVEAVGLSSLVPLRGHSGWFFEIENPADPDSEDTPVTLTRFASASYFDTMGIEFVAGEPFGEYDNGPDGPHTVVVNEAFALNSWGRLDAVGERVRVGGDEAPWLTVVGVSRNTQHYGLEDPVRQGVFLPFRAAVGGRFAMYVAARGPDDPAALTSAVREAVRRVDARIPLFEISTMQQRMAESTFERRAYSTLLGGFALAALLLALAGIYSTVSYAVGQRQHEIGIRMALGARADQVLRGVLRDGLRLAAVGLVLGVGLAALAARGMSTVLIGVSQTDPVTYGGVALLLAAAAVAANWVPARRAARMSPGETLRSD